MDNEKGLFDAVFDFEIKADSSKMLLNKVKSTREKINGADTDLLKPTGIVENLKNLDKIPTGRFQVKHHTLFDCFFVPGSKEEPLFVFLNGSRVKNVPEFKRWSYYNKLSGPVLNIADPMYREYDSLRFGWYWGNEQENYREYTADVIQKVSKTIGCTEIVIVGSSAGGGPAAYIANLLDNAKALMINPQLKLSLYSQSKHLVETVNASLDDDPFFRGDMTDLVSPDSPVKTVLVCNISSVTDREQLDHLCGKHGIPIKYGLSKKGNLIIWTYSTPEERSHQMMEYYPMIYPMFTLLRHFDDAEKMEGWFTLLSETWNDHFRLEDELKTKKTKDVQGRGFVGKDYINITDNRHIPKSEDIWVHETVLKNMKPKTTYIFTLNEVNSPTLRKGIVVIVKDTSNNTAVCKEKMDPEEKPRFVFMTGDKGDDLELRLYPDTLGAPNPSEVSIGYNLQTWVGNDE